MKIQKPYNGNDGVFYQPSLNIIFLLEWTGIKYCTDELGDCKEYKLWDGDEFKRRPFVGVVFNAKGCVYLGPL